ncbi:MAG: tripartite tricarboxylate transporter TctB family protein [Rhodospirillales bacterium]
MEPKNCNIENPAPAPSDFGAQPGGLFFACCCFAAAVVLLAFIGDQTRWFKGMAAALQPRFMPAVSLTLLCVFSGLFLAQTIRARRRAGTGGGRFAPAGELIIWLKPLEFGAYFTAYAWFITIAGYLSATVVFMVLLGARMNYRRPRDMVLFAAGAVVIVLMFKTGLEVRLPSGAVYEYLPGGLKPFMMRNF